MSVGREIEYNVVFYLQTLIHFFHKKHTFIIYILSQSRAFGIVIKYILTTQFTISVDEAQLYTK